MTAALLRNPLGAKQFGDEALLQKLDAHPGLAPNERRAVTEAMASFVMHGRLVKSMRDWMCAIAKAHQLFRSTTIKKKPHAANLNIGNDPYSERPGPVHPACLVLPKVPPSQRKAG